MATSALLSSFETPRKRAAPQDEGFVRDNELAAFLKHSRHRQSSPVTGIGRRAVSVSHQHSPDRLHVNSTPQRGQPTRREAGFWFCNRSDMTMHSNRRGQRKSRGINLLVQSVAKQDWMLRRKCSSE
jgi:hypothetical protein